MIDIRDRLDWSSRYVLTDGTELSAVDLPEISYISSSELKMNIKGGWTIPPGANLYTNRLKAYITINGEEYACGRFIVTSRTDRRVGGVEYSELEGYSELYLAKRKKVEDRMHIAAGTNYLAAVRNLLISSGITAINTDDPSSLTLATAREDWESGTSYLTIVNQLLDEINYHSAWIDLAGTVHLSKATGALPPVKHTYNEGQYSVISDSYAKSDDTYGKYNVARVVCANPDRTAPMVATATLTDPSVPYSIPNIGRVLHIESVDNIASQAVLQAKADELILKARQKTESCEFYTAIDPTHGAHDVIALQRGSLAGKWQETEWRMPMSGAADMTHKAERVIIA